MKELILYPGKEIRFERDGRIRRANIVKIYQGYALCQVGKKRDFIFFREILEK